MNDNAKPPGNTSAGELLALTAGTVVAVSGLVVWIGAALAAALSGSRFTGGVQDAVYAIPRLGSRMRFPDRAWPDKAFPDSVNPFLYWASTLLTALVVAAVVVVGSRVRRRLVGTSRRRLGVEVRARFAVLSDLGALVVSEPPPSGRLALGRVAGRLVATEDRALSPGTDRARQGDRGSVAVIGPTRCGKTSNLIASIREWDGPAVLVSVKRDLLDATIEARTGRGQVAVFDPAAVAGVPESLTARWSPLRAASTPTGAQKAAAALAAAIPRSGIEGGNDYWIKQGEILLTGLLAAAALDPTITMANVARWVFTQDMPILGERPSEVLGLVMDAYDHGHEVELAAAAIHHLDAIWKQDPRVRSSIYATVQTAVHAWFDPAVEESATLPTPWSSFTSLDFLADRSGSNTLYLVAPLDDQRRLAPVLGGLLGDLKDQAFSRDAAGVRLERPILMVIDEAANMPLAWLPEVASTCAGIGILLVTIWQSKAQIDAAYGRLADSVLTNHLTKIVFSGCSDTSTLDYVSRLLGDDEVTKRSWSSDIGNGNGRRSISESTTREALTPFHLLRQVRPGEAVLVHGTLPPAHLHARRHWDGTRL